MSLFVNKQSNSNILLDQKHINISLIQKNEINDANEIYIYDTFLTHAAIVKYDEKPKK